MLVISNLTLGNTDKELQGPKHVNDEIEKELVTFKKEIESKFAKSKMNKNFKFPLKPQNVLT
jgi:hypothetical protein